MVLFLSLIVTRLATTALTLTGLSREAARFQARSAWTGTGFTTAEAEKVVDHPVRRRIVMLLMVVRSAGLMSIIVSLVLSFVGTGGDVSRLGRLLWLLGGVVLLWLLANSRVLDRWLNRIMTWALGRWTDLDTRDYTSLLNLSGEYAINELKIREGDWLAGKPLSECRLRDEGITVLGIHRDDGDYIGAPKADTELYAGDTVILYGRAEALRRLDDRRADAAGEREHEQARNEQEAKVAEQDRREEEHRRRRTARQQDRKPPPRKAGD